MEESSGEGSAAEKPWYEVSFENLNEGFSPALEPHWAADEWPEWVANALREVMKTMMPVAQLRDGMKTTPRMLGGILGHQIAAWNEMGAMVSQSDTSQKAAAAMLIPATGFPQNYAEMLIGFGNNLTETMKRICGLAIEADYAECVEFFEAFTRGMKTAPSTLLRTNTGILLVMAVLWKKVESFESVRELHGWLSSVMSPQLVGSLKRIEKMCQRIGFRVRGKGRPKKAERTAKFRQRKR